MRQVREDKLCQYFFLSNVRWVRIRGYGWQLHYALPLKVKHFIFIVEQLTHYLLRSHHTTIYQDLSINREQLSCLSHLLVIKGKYVSFVYMNVSCLCNINGLQKTDCFLQEISWVDEDLKIKKDIAKSPN